MAMSRARLVRNALVMWLILLLLAFLNGALRELLLARLIGEPALLVSGITAILLFTAAIFLFVRRAGPTASEAIAIGVGWLVLTILLELLLFTAQGRPGLIVEVFTWRAITGGNLFAILIAVVTVTPVLFAWRLRR
jgi:hypothetical protein